MDKEFMTSGQNLMTPQTQVSSVRPKRIFSAVQNSNPAHRLPPIGKQSGTTLYREPDMMRVAPQNIMHDRRICRGNTFAALVIPVNMQPLQRPQTHVNKNRSRPNFQINKRVMSSRNPRAQFASTTNLMGSRGSENNLHATNARSNRVNSASRFMQLQHQDQNQDNMLGQSQQFAISKHQIYEDLSDVENMVDEEEIEVDYYIDKAADAVFVPESPKHDKMTHLDDRKDPDLFDFDLEVEPLLQVLIGKSLELARVEIIEELEQDKFEAHKIKYAKLRESELLATQRLEAQRHRIGWEKESRDRQRTIHKQHLFNNDQTLLARYAAKKCLSFLKRDTMQELVDQKILINRSKAGVEGVIVRNIQEEGQGQLMWKKTVEPILLEATSSAAQRLAANHRQNIKNELRKRNKREYEKRKELQRKEEETHQRKQNRAMKREELRISERMDSLFYEGFHHCKKVEDQSIVDCYVLDMGDPISYINNISAEELDNNGAIFSFGGMLGEIMLVFSCLADFVFANPTNVDFQFTQESIEQFLVNYFCVEHPDCAPMHVWLKDEAISESAYDNENYLNEMLQGEHFTGQGFKFLLQHGIDIQLQFENVVKPFLQVINKMANKQHVIQPDKGHESAEEHELNQEEQPQMSAREQQLTEELKERIMVFYPQPGQMEEVEELGDCQAYVQVRNYRYGQTPADHIENREDIEAPPSLKRDSISQPSMSKNQKSKDDLTRRSQQSVSGVSQSRVPGGPESSQGTGEQFDLEQISKVCLMMPAVLENVPLCVQHVDAVYFIRKAIIDCAIKSWPEMRDLNVNKIMGELCAKHSLLEQQFEKKLVHDFGYNYGLAYLGGINLRVVFRTMLEFGHQPSLEQVAQKEYIPYCQPNAMNSIDSGSMVQQTF